MVASSVVPMAKPPTTSAKCTDPVRRRAGAMVLISQTQSSVLRPDGAELAAHLPIQQTAGH
jgi:hypothetical protein